jgi:hypothetical protein
VEFKVAYYNWYDGLIQFTDIRANSGLDAMKEIEPSTILNEEQYCQSFIKQGGFIGYEIQT